MWLDKGSFHRAVALVGGPNFPAAAAAAAARGDDAAEPAAAVAVAGRTAGGVHLFTEGTFPAAFPNPTMVLLQEPCGMTAEECCQELSHWTITNGGLKNRFVIGPIGCCTLVDIAADETLTTTALRGYEGGGAGMRGVAVVKSKKLKNARSNPTDLARESRGLGT